VMRAARVELAGGQIEFRTEVGRIALVTDGTPASVAAPLLPTDGTIEAWANESWCCLVGSRSPDVIVAIPGESRIVNVGQLNRLDLEDAYDPSGLHRVDFRPLETGDLLVVYEFGVARISPDAGIVWQRVHRDLTARLESTDDDRV